MATPLSDEIRALITFANETTEAGDTKLGDCVKTLCEGYNGGKNVPSSPLVVPQGALSSRLAALLAYANETTGAGDTTMGDAIRTLCEGYGKLSPIFSIEKAFNGSISEAIVTDYSLWNSEMQQWTLVSFCPDNSTRTRGVAIHCMYEASSYPGFVRQSGNNASRGVNWNIVKSKNWRWGKTTAIWEQNDNNCFMENVEKPFAISRSSNHIYYTTDGKNWVEFVEECPTIDSPLVIGAKRNTKGSLLQPYNSNGNIMRLELYDKAKCDVSSFFDSYLTSNS